MKKTFLYTTVIAAATLVACNNQQSDPVEKADSTNEVKQEQAPVEDKSAKNTSEFLVKAADGGMAEVDAGKLGVQKAGNKAVKDFAAEMVKDHTAANAEVKTLAAANNVTLPEATSDDNKKKAADVSEKKAGKDFDKAFIDMMVDDHKKVISLFDDASDDDLKPDVKTFINNTLPKLKEHLAKAESIQNNLK